MKFPKLYIQVLIKIAIFFSDIWKVDQSPFLPTIRMHKQLHKNVSLLKMLRNEPILIKRSKT